MKKIPAIVALLAAVALPAFQLARAAAQTFEGVVSDSMCEKKHMMPGKSDADCIAECIKAGSAYVLVADNKVYTLTAKPGVLAAYAGKHVKVQGELKNNTITVAAIH
jgi:hypothetical protein